MATALASRRPGFVAILTPSPQKMEVEAPSAIALPEVVVEGVAFASSSSPPGSSTSLFLAGAGARGMEVGGGKYVNFTAIGVYLDKAAATAALAGKWKGKTADELASSADFFRDIYAGSFEKLTRVTMIVPLTGQQYSEKVAENCVESWKAAGTFADVEAAAAEKLLEVFRPETFPPGSSIFFTHSASGELEIGFSKGGDAPANKAAIIESRALSEAVLASIIGERGVSPEAKKSVAARLSGVLVEA